MEILRSIEAAKAAPLAPSVATVGTFEGVHLGHRTVIREVVATARVLGATPVVVTFSRHPRAVIEGRAPMLLTSIGHRLRILESLGVGAVLMLDFDESLRRTKAEDFAREVFGEALGCLRVVLGYNNRFGRGGEGDIETLRRVGARCGFEAIQGPEVALGGVPVSSTVIRNAVLEGNLEVAARMLGRPFSVLGTVVEGDGRGRTIGYPTANLDLHHEVRPPRGVYGCEVRIDGPDVAGREGGRGPGRAGLVNIGVRPTVGGQATNGVPDWDERDREDKVEVHVLDYEGDLYGTELEAAFLLRVRGERKFPSLDDLKVQIAEDEEVFRAWLADHPH